MIAKDPDTGDELRMPETAEEYDRLKARIGARPDQCCNSAGPVDHWPSFRCSGPNGPGLLIRPHCTAGGCF